MRWYHILLIILLLASGLTPPVAAHGTTIAYTTGTGVAIVATFDSGEPMAGAQVTVYAPNDPMHPWMTGVCDEAGRFSFLPDPALPGNWEVQVRQSGHGDIVVIPIGAETGADTGISSRVATTGTSGGYTPLQLVVMGASVIWGCIGTALFFINRK